jgi:hypothetical protein
MFSFVWDITLFLDLLKGQLIGTPAYFMGKSTFLLISLKPIDEIGGI